MYTFFISVLCFTSACCVHGFATGYVQRHRVVEEANKKAVRALIQAYNARDYDAVVDKHVAPNLIQHDPTTGDGRDAFKKSLQAAFKGTGPEGPQIEIVRLMAEGAFVFLHTGRVNEEGNALSVMHVFRMQDGMLVEEWKVSVELTPEMMAEAPNSHPLF